jgi:hypothetical protein
MDGSFEDARLTERVSALLSLTATASSSVRCAPLPATETTTTEGQITSVFVLLVKEALATDEVHAVLSLG